MRPVPRQKTRLKNNIPVSTFFVFMIKNIKVKNYFQKYIKV
jgi:hypothetical protein